jgi:parallel beta-helix repeat protein
VSVQSGATLTITPGTTVKFNSLKFLAVMGTLVARGTVTNPITFTSNQPSPAVGDWGYIYFSGSSIDAAFDGDGNYTGGSIIQNAVIEYAGGASASNNGALCIDASAPFIDDNKIRNNQGNGISIWSPSTPRLPRIKGNTIAHNSGAGVYVDYNNAIIQDNTITGHPGSGINICARYSSNPTIQGNTITGNSALLGGGIHISYGAAIISSNIITGNSASQGGGIYLGGTNPTIQGNTIASNTATENNGGGGIYLAGSSPTIHDNDLYGNMTGNPATIPNDLYNGNAYGGAAVDAMNNDWGTTDPAVIEDHIWHFLDDPLLGFVSYDPFPSIPCMILGIVGTDTMWSPSQCVPYIVTGHLSVQPGATLTIQPGTTVKFDSLKVLAVAGTLVARGTDANPIIFTSNQPSPAAGDWGYIYFSGSSVDATFDGDGNYTGGSIIRHAVIKYAGGVSVIHNGALRIEDSSPFIDHSTIEDNQDNGIFIWDPGTSRIRGNTIAHNSGAGICVDYSNPIIQDNTITDHSRSGINICARYSSSPTIQGNTITGNSASLGGGIHISYGTAFISCNTIANNTATERHGGGGIYLANYSRPTIHDNNLYGNMTGNPANVPNDLYNGNVDDSPAVDATNNYWGTTDRVVIEDHIWHCLDDPSEWGCVNYEFWRTSPVPPCTPAPAIEVSISGPTTGITNSAYTFTATVSPLTAAQPITYAWQATRQSSVTYTNGLSNTVTFTWTTPGAQVITVTATNVEGTATDAHAITIGRPVPVERVAINGPTTGTAGTPYTFTASASPLTATRPITYVWQATGQSEVVHAGGLSDRATFTWTTAGTQVITVTASNAWGSARANHTTVISEPGTGGDAYEPDDACTQASLLKTDGTAQQHTFHQRADADWAHFTVTSSITYVLQAVSTSTGADLALELYDTCGGNLLDSHDNAFGANARLIFAAPSSGVYYVKALNHAPSVYGPDVTYELSVRTQSQAGVAIIVAGRKYSSEGLQANINYVANQAFRVFKDGGIPPEDIYYLHHDTTQDADGDGHPDVDTTATTSTLQYAITTWAVSRAGPGAPLYLYLVDHGTNDLFLIDGYGDAVTPGQLDGWLNILEDSTGCQVNVIIESCKSGSFIAAPPEISKPGRVIVTSAASHQSAHAYSDGQGAYFSNHFLSLLGDNADLWTSYSQTRASLERTRLGQTPWLDDNGDAISNEQDGAIARQRGLISPTLEAIPWIASVSAPVQIDGYSAAITATVYEDKPGALVWAEIIAPSYPIPDHEDEMVYIDVPRLLLSDGNGDGTYEGTYGGFTEIGEYRVIVYARDVDRNQGLPKGTTVRTGWLVYLPMVLR